ncbi:MAG: bifunctional riboflavin kinase/FAD synthetase [Flavobacteriales bacterium]|jgi:riboflavin kinase/FMN adenylyltransferase|nr:bifunctional riboflavin kinase/FAD synthetase [Flavobacteriales bacterium]MBL6869960.1 bifunctional riboflavin kinase/FAD synthetase [Flavobacteriales bacterium]
MQVHYGFESYKNIKNPIVTVGTFDGVHFGHQKIIQRLQKIAKKNNGESVLLTFDPHPRKILLNDQGLKLIHTINEKINILENLGLDHLVIYPFTLEFSKFSAKRYIDELLIQKLGTHTLVIGYDHHFGNDREGNIDLLKKYEKSNPFYLEEIKAHEIEEIKISSTKVRSAIEKGNIHLVNDYCGHFYEFSGEVVRGNGIGKTIGTPTANIKLNSNEKIIPLDGVYAVVCQIKDANYKGIMNIGFKPTVDEGQKRTVEIHLFDYEKDIYGQDLRTKVIERIRDEVKFNSLKELKSQILKDNEKAKIILESF